MQQLVDAGADVQARDKTGRTPLHLLREKDTDRPSKEIIECLLNAGAHIDARDHSDNTPMDLFGIAPRPLKRKNDGNEATVSQEPLVQVNPLHHLSLKCLASRTVVAHNLLLPMEMTYGPLLTTDQREFVNKH